MMTFEEELEKRGYPESELRDIWAWFELYGVGREDCQDNERVALVGNHEEERRYESARLNGCCGSVDDVVECPSGRSYCVGFNHGH